jgi:hypothetical protein
MATKKASRAARWAREELATLRQWQSRWNGPSFPANAPDVLVTKTGQRVRATHGSFDNNIDALTETLQRVAGKKLAAPMEWLDCE